MRKTFCDRHPDRECINRVGHLHLSVVQQTNKGEVVSEDDYRPMDVCGDCIDELIGTFFVGAPLQAYKSDAIAEESAVRLPTMDGERR